MTTLTLNQRDHVAEQLILALARREHRGLAQPRLTEPGLATWRAFKGNLTHAHLLGLVAQDAAIRFPLPASLSAVVGDATSADFSSVSAPEAFGWLKAVTPDRLAASTADTLTAIARTLSLPFRFAGASLHKLQAATRVVELPGTGGQLVARALERSPEAALHINCTVLTSTWADRAMAGFVAMELDAPSQDFIVDDPALNWATAPDNRSRFDLVFGLQPEKGGAHTEADLQQAFPTATIVLV